LCDESGFEVFSIQYSVFSNPSRSGGGILLAICASGICLAFASQARAETEFERDCAKLAARKGKDGERLHALFKLDWDYTMRESPEFATEVGYPGRMIGGPIHRSKPSSGENTSCKRRTR